MDDLRNLITYENALRYMTHNDSVGEVGYLDDFVLTRIMDLPFYNICECSVKAKKIFRELYLRAVANEKLLGGTELLEAVRSYVLADGVNDEPVQRWARNSFERFLNGERGVKC